MPLPTPIFNIFDEFEALNTPNALDTGGEWKLISAPTNPVDICVKDTVWETKNLNAGDIIYPGVHSVLIDFTGASCAGSPAPDGIYVFEYYIPGGQCPSTSQFSMEVIDGNFTVLIDRTPDVCLIEMYSENPDTAGSKRAKVQLLDPNKMCAKFSVRYLVKRYNLDGCSSPATTLHNNVKTYGDYDISATNLPNALGNTNPWYIGSPIFGNLPGLFMMHKYVIQVGGWNVGDYIESIKVGRASGFPNTHEILDLSTVVAIGDLSVPTNLATFVSGLRSRIANRLTALGAGNTNALFEVSDFYSGPNPEVHISFLCVHIPNDEWFGIDKNDWEVIFWVGGIQEIETTLINDFVSVEQFCLNYLNMFDEYNVENCKFYTSSSSCQVVVGNSICSTVYDDIYNFANCNYDFLEIISNVNARANVLDFDNACSIS